MKKLALAVALALAACVATFGAEQISAEEAFKIALRPTGNPIIGIWRIHSSSGERAAHMAIVPNTTGRHGSWAYLGIMLEDGFLLRKSGIKIALRPTRFAHTYDVILSNTASRIGAIYLDGNGFAFLDGAVLDMSRVKVPYVETIFYDIERHAPITHMTKVRNFQMETASRTISLSGLYFDGLEVSAVTPGSIADLAGLKPGDTILALNGRPADEPMLRDIDTRLSVSRAVMIEYERGGKRDLVTLR